MTEPHEVDQQRWLTRRSGHRSTSLVADVGHEITALLCNLLAATLTPVAAALGLIQDIADGLAGTARLAGGAIADDPPRRLHSSSVLSR
jgi:hypothetical protein